MGQILARLFSGFGRYKNHQKLLMLGLDGAGMFLASQVSPSFQVKKAIFVMLAVFRSPIVFSNCDRNCILEYIQTIRALQNV